MAESTPSGRRPRLTAGGVAGGIAHLLLLLYTASLILRETGPDWTAHWIMFLALDFPISLGVMPVTWLVPPSPAGPLRDLSNFWWPLAYHAVVGTGWWTIVGDYIQCRFRRGTPESES